MPEATPETVPGPSHDLPAAVVIVLREAAEGSLLRDADNLAVGLERAGWVREIAGGAWSSPAAPGWAVFSSAAPAHVSLFAAAPAIEELHPVVTTVRSYLDTGGAGSLRAGEPDPDVTSWSTDEVRVALYVTAEREVFGRPVPASLQLSLEVAGSEDGPSGTASKEALRVAREGTPAQRWYLAGEERLDEEVVALLSVDPDPAVVAALDHGASHRAVVTSVS